MKKFQFTLDAVKRLRAHAERDAQSELGERIAAHAAAERAVEARRRMLEAASGRLRQGLPTVAALLQADRERGVALMLVENAGAAADAEGRMVVDARGRLAEARKALETIEKLEERRRAEHQEQAQREEEELLQDVVQARAARTAQRKARA
jgi:flagellar export protein FliJ